MPYTEANDTPDQVGDECADRLAETYVCQMGIDFNTNSQEAIGLFRPPREASSLPIDRLTDEGVSEVVLLATCHRLEFYVAAQDPARAESALARQLEAMRPEHEQGDLAPAVRLDTEAMRHLISITAGLESARLGEYEILGQVRRAYRAARAAGTTGPFLDRMFQHAISAAREIRSTLGISHQKRSLTDTAIDWIRSYVAETDDRVAVVVGAGETASAMAEQLAGLGVGKLTVLNRTPDRAARIASLLGGEGGPLDRLPAAVEEADIVVCAMSGTQPVLRVNHLTRWGSGADDRLKLVVDFGVPRNTEDKIANMPGVHVLDMYGILDLALGEDSQRLEWAANAEELLNSEAQKFSEWRRAHSISPVLKELRGHYEDAITIEAERTLNAGGQDGSDLPQDEIARFAARLSGRLLHTFYTGLKEIAVQNSPQRAHEITRQLMLRDSN
jgi:glutamyl-tRNA reductase